VRLVLTFRLDGIAWSDYRIVLLVYLPAVSWEPPPAGQGLKLSCNGSYSVMSRYADGREPARRDAGTTRARSCSPLEGRGQRVERGVLTLRTDYAAGLGANRSEQITFAVQTLLVESALPMWASEEDHRNSRFGRAASATEALAPEIVPSRDRLPQCYRTVSAP
jgi:hypothetical protein